MFHIQNRQIVVVRQLFCSPHLFRTKLNLTETLILSVVNWQISLTVLFYHIYQVLYSSCHRGFYWDAHTEMCFLNWKYSKTLVICLCYDVMLSRPSLRVTTWKKKSSSAKRVYWNYTQYFTKSHCFALLFSVMFDPIALKCVVNPFVCAPQRFWLLLCCTIPCSQKLYRLPNAMVQWPLGGRERERTDHWSPARQRLRAR